MNWLLKLGMSVPWERQHFFQILALAGKSNKTHGYEENQRESAMHSDGAIEQPIQFAMVLITHVDALPV